MHKLNEKTEGESPRVTLRMDAGCMKIVERVARSLKGDKSQAIRAIVQAHGQGNKTQDVSAIEKERDDARRERDAYKRAKEENNERFMRERDEALAERDSAREALKNARKELDALHSVPVVPVPDAHKPASAPVEPADDAVHNTTLRARWTTLKIPLRAFVARHDITRTPFQKWAAGERDMHGETLARYEAAIAAEEAAK